MAEISIFACYSFWLLSIHLLNQPRCRYVFPLVRHLRMAFTTGTRFLTLYPVTWNSRPLQPWPEAGKPVEGAWESVITSETWAALEIHNSVPSLHLSSPPGQAPLGSFIFVLMAALDNGAAEKSQNVKTQLWHGWPSLSLSKIVHQSRLKIDPLLLRP